MYKPGDAVRIKAGISSVTHGKVWPDFTEYMDKYLGRILSVTDQREYGVVDKGAVECEADNDKWHYLPEWLEPWNDDESWNGTEWVKKC